MGLQKAAERGSSLKRNGSGLTASSVCASLSRFSGWGDRMLYFIRAASLLSAGGLVLSLICCVPVLKSSPERGPTAIDIVNHINCELASIVNAKNARINEWIDASPFDLRKKLDYLTEYHFVASVLVTLDALDSQSVNPSFNFIKPYNAMGSLNQTWAIGGTLGGSQERNISFGYSVDLGELKDINARGHLQHVSSIERYCVGPVGVADKDSGPLTDDLGLTDIVVDGLLGLDAAQYVNLYGNSGPSALTVSVNIDQPDRPLELQFGDLGKLKFVGNISFTPSTVDTKAPGTVSLTGKLTSDDRQNNYFASLSGSTIQQSETGKVTFSLSGTMSKLEGDHTDQWSRLGFGPKLNLAGSINHKYDATSIKLAGNVTPDPAGTEIVVTQPSNASGTVKSLSGGGGGSGAGGSTKASGAASGGGSTLFGSLVNFILSYGINGGPNWTLTRFKGPSAGSSSLVNLSRTDTDTLTITFVPACKNGPNIRTPRNFWESLPHCDSWSRAAAASSGFANNTLIQTGRGL
jgi:hypothetical protein